MTVFLEEMKLPEVREFLKTGYSALVPTGSCEQHGPHLPYIVDSLIPKRVCERVAPRIGALVAPAINYGVSSPHIGSKGAVWLQSRTLYSVIEDVTLSLAQSGFKRIAFVNGHYCNEPVIYLASLDLNFGGKLPRGTKVFGFSYWNAMPGEDLNRYLSFDAGWHANIGETSAILAIRPDLVDMRKAPAEWPKETKTSALLLNVLSSSVPHTIICKETGAWGDARDSTAAKGEEYLNAIVEGVVTAWKDLEAAFKKFEHME